MKESSVAKKIFVTVLEFDSSMTVKHGSQERQKNESTVNES